MTIMHMVRLLGDSNEYIQGSQNMPAHMHMTAVLKL